MMETKMILEILRDLSDRLRVKGENEFKARAYENAADIIEIQKIDVQQKVEDGTLGKIEGFGEALVEKITDLIQNGKMQYYEKLKEEVPDELMELLNIEGLGHKKVHRLHKELGITNIGDLEKSAENNEISELKGFSKKSESSILEKLREYKSKKTSSVGKEFKHIR